MAKIEISKVNAHIEVHSRVGDNVALQAIDGTPKLNQADMEKAMQKACDDQVKTLEEAARRTCDFEATAAGGEE